VSIRDKIRNSQDVRCERVTVPEWDVTLEIRGLSLPEYAAYERWRDDGKKEGDTISGEEMYTKYIILSARDEQGGLVFERSDYDWLKEKPFHLLEPLIEAVKRVRSGTLKEEVADAKNGSATIRSSSSATNSPNCSGSAMSVDSSETSAPSRSSPNGSLTSSSPDRSAASERTSRPV
jgi:hypothetical protein